jgi:hypothetical protein
MLAIDNVGEQRVELGLEDRLKSTEYEISARACIDEEAEVDRRKVPG